MTGSLILGFLVEPRALLGFPVIIVAAMLGLFALMKLFAWWRGG